MRIPFKLRTVWHHSSQSESPEQGFVIGDATVFSQSVSRPVAEAHCSKTKTLSGKNQLRVRTAGIGGQYQVGAIGFRSSTLHPHTGHLNSDDLGTNF